MLLNEQTAVQLGDKKVLGVRQGDKFILGRHNLVPNGRGKYTSGTVEVRRNLASDPRQVTAAGKSNLTLVTGQFGPFSTASRGQVNGPWKDFSPIDIVSASSTEIQMVARFWLATSTRLFIQNLTDNKTVTASWDGKLYCLDTGELASGGYPITDGVLREYACTFTVPATQTTPWRFGFKNAFGDSVDRGEITMTGFCMESGTQAIRPYFDGSYSPDPDLTPSWTGTANESASVLRGVRMSAIDFITVPGTFAVQSTQWPNGGTSARIIPGGSGNDTFISPGGDVGAMRLGMVAGRPTAVRARGYLPVPQTGTIGQNGARQIELVIRAPNYTFLNGTQGPNVAGEFISEVVTTLPPDATEAFVRLYNGASAGNGEIYWTDIRICQADTEEEALRMVRAPYRDGDFPGWTWDGMPGESSSRGLS